MGLRKGELVGLQWTDIDFDKSIMSITKQIPSIYGASNYKITPLKTQNSNRVLPMNNVVKNALKMLKEESQNILIIKILGLYLEMTYLFLKKK